MNPDEIVETVTSEETPLAQLDRIELAIYRIETMFNEIMTWKDELEAQIEAAKSSGMLGMVAKMFGAK